MMAVCLLCASHGFFALQTFDKVSGVFLFAVGWGVSADDNDDPKEVEFP